MTKIINKEAVNILLVEDEVITAMYIKMELRKAGFNNIRNVGTGERAVEIALLEKPDLILMDVNLSGKMNGLEAAREIINIYSTNIIFMTGYQDELILKEIKKIQSSVYLTKPVDHHRMIELMTVLLIAETKTC